MVWSLDALTTRPVPYLMVQIFTRGKLEAKGSEKVGASCRPFSCDQANDWAVTYRKFTLTLLVRCTETSLCSWVASCRIDDLRGRKVSGSRVNCGCRARSSDRPCLRTFDHNQRLVWLGRWCFGIRTRGTSVHIIERVWLKGAPDRCRDNDRVQSPQAHHALNNESKPPPIPASRRW